VAAAGAPNDAVEDAMDGRGSMQAIGAAPTFAETTDLDVLGNTHVDVVDGDAMARGYAAWAVFDNSTTPTFVMRDDLPPSTLPIEVVAEGLVLGFGEVSS
jgi:hypothetical protein